MSEINSPREQALKDYTQCHEAGMAAYHRAQKPVEAYNREILDIQKAMSRSMEIAAAALEPLLSVGRANELQAKQAYKKAFEEEREKVITKFKR